MAAPSRATVERAGVLLNGRATPKRWSVQARHPFEPVDSRMRDVIRVDEAAVASAGGATGMAVAPWRALRTDLAVNDDAFAKIAVLLYRMSQGLGSAGKFASVVMRVVCGADVPRAVHAGPGLRLPHGGRGVVVHSEAVVGAHVTILHGVTVGVTAAGQRAPYLEDGVYVGSGACVLGAITLGAHSKVGANCVVLTDVPPGRTAVGIPARIL